MRRLTLRGSGAGRPMVTGLPDGGFVVGWNHLSGPAGIRLQALDGMGRKLGGEVVVSTSTAGGQFDSTVASLSDGRIMVGWTDYERTASDDLSPYDIKAQVLQPAEANAAPVAGDDRRAGAEDAAIVGRVAATDADGDALSFSLVEGARDANGEPVAGLTFNADGTYRFLGPRDFNGTVSFTYTAGDGLLASNEATVTLEVAPGADAPVAGADGFGATGRPPVHDGAMVRIDLTALLSNDRDPDGGALRFAGIASGPALGTLDVVTEGGRTHLAYEYTGPRLAPDAAANDGFTYRVADASGGATIAAVSLTVTGLANGSSNGTAGSDTLKGSDLHNDTMSAGDGHDGVFGLAGRDRLFGGNGDDRLHGGDGADLAFGGAGRDRLRGGDGADRLWGGDGDDGLSGGTGDDRLDGGGGDDLVLGQAGRDRLFGGDGDDRLKGEDGADTLHGGAGHDRLGGGADDDGLHGGRGSDGLRGSQGADRLWGGSGGDTLNGGSGHDRLWAGRDAGRDVIVFGSILDSRTGSRDIVHDFDGGEDKIDLRGIDALDYAGTRAAAHAVWWTREGGVIVSGDVTGDHAADFQIAVADVPSLGQDDVLL